MEITATRLALRKLPEEASGSLGDLAPIVLVIGFFQFLVLRQPLAGAWTLIGGGVLVVLGLRFSSSGSSSHSFPSARPWPSSWQGRAVEERPEGLRMRCSTN